MELDFIPIEVARVWRACIWLAGLSLIGSQLAFLPRAWKHRNGAELMTKWALLLYTAVFFYLVQASLAQLDRWDDPVLLRGLPLTTVIMFWLCWARIVRHRSHDS